MMQNGVLYYDTIAIGIFIQYKDKQPCHPRRDGLTGWLELPRRDTSDLVTQDNGEMTLVVLDVTQGLADLSIELSTLFAECIQALDQLASRQSMDVCWAEEELFHDSTLS